MRRCRSMMAKMAAAATLCCSASLKRVGVNGIEWSETTSSTSINVYSAPVGELFELVIEPGERASIDFVGDPSNHFAVSYRQCSLKPAQPLQIQYSGKLNYMPYVGGCLYAENEVAEIGADGCTFWQYNPSETWSVSGTIYEESELLVPDRVRFENQGDANATVEVAMFSEDIPIPPALADTDIWIEEGYTKKDRLINTTINVYFNNDNSYCDAFGCTVDGYVNDYVEDQDSLSLCQVQADGTLYYEDILFDTYIPLTFDLPGNKEYYVTVVLKATDTVKGHSNYTAMEDFGTHQIIVFQTDTTQPDNGGLPRVLAGLSLLSLTWLMLFSTLVASLGANFAQMHETVIPALGW